MTTFLFHIHPDTEEAEMMGGACSLVIVEKDHFEEHGALASEHILEDIVNETGLTELEDVLDEIAESMFVSTLPADEIRALLVANDGFDEAVLFEDEAA